METITLTLSREERNALADLCDVVSRASGFETGKPSRFDEEIETLEQIEECGVDWDDLSKRLAG